VIDFVFNDIRLFWMQIRGSENPRSVEKKGTDEYSVMVKTSQQEP
jgi:hypothetical protein